MLLPVHLLGAHELLNVLDWLVELGIELQVGLGLAGDETGEDKQADEVRDGHEAVGQVGEGPYDVKLGHRADEDDDGEEHAVWDGGHSAEEGGQCTLAVVRPADDGGEGEEDDGQGDNSAAPMAGQAGLESLGGHDAGFVASHVPHAGHHDDKAGDSHDDERIDECLSHGDECLTGWVRGLGGSCCDCGGTHTRLVGEDTAGDTVLDDHDDGGTDEAAGRGGAGEGISEDEAQCFWNLAGVDDKDYEAADHVDDDHQRNEGGGDTANGLDAAQKNCADEYEHERAGGYWGDSEGGFHVGGHGVGLRQVADTEGCKYCEDGEGGSESCAEWAFDAAFQVVLRSAGLLTLGVGSAEADTEVSLGLLRGHAHEARDPDPDEGTWAADGQRGGDADDVAHTDGGGECSGKRLVVGDIAFGGLVVGVVDEGVAQGTTERAELNAAEADGQP